jgi:hypothetical protein
MALKVIHSRQNIFCYVVHICNLVPEFNGLVSKGVNRKIDPFYVLKIRCLSFIFLMLSLFFFADFFSTFTSDKQPLTDGMFSF